MKSSAFKNSFFYLLLIISIFHFDCFKAYAEEPASSINLTNREKFIRFEYPKTFWGSSGLVTKKGEMELTIENFKVISKGQSKILENIEQSQNYARQSVIFGGLGLITALGAVVVLFKTDNFAYYFGLTSLGLSSILYSSHCAHHSFHYYLEAVNQFNGVYDNKQSHTDFSFKPNLNILSKQRTQNSSKLFIPLLSKSF